MVMDLFTGCGFQKRLFGKTVFLDFVIMVIFADLEGAVAAMVMTVVMMTVRHNINAVSVMAMRNQGMTKYRGHSHEHKKQRYFPLQFHFLKNGGKGTKNNMTYFMLLSQLFFSRTNTTTYVQRIYSNSNFHLRWLQSQKAGA